MSVCDVRGNEEDDQGGGYIEIMYFAEIDLKVENFIRYKSLLVLVKATYSLFIVICF